MASIERLTTLILMLSLTGCYAATRSTVHMMEANQSLSEARDAGASSRAVYAWTTADEYMKKARDEWARSEFESAEQLFAKSKKWSEEAARLARTAPADAIEVLPEERPERPAQPKIAPPAPSEPILSPEDFEDEDDDEGAWE
jgi:hypothetical protein